MAQPRLNKIPLLLITGVMASINGAIIGVLMLRDIVKVGFSRYFYVKKRDRPPACLTNPSLGTHAFARLKSLRLHYVYNGQEGRPLMLFLHGFPEFWYSWRHQLTEFAKDFRVVAVDMRGYGESDKPQNVSSYYIATLAEDIKELVSALGYEKCILVAHDWGGAVGYQVAQMYPEVLKLYISINVPHPRAFQKHLMSSISQNLKSWYMFFFNIPWLPEIYTSSQDFKFLEAALSGNGCTDDDVEAYKYTLSRPGDLTGPINYYRAGFRYAEPTGVPKETLKMPVLMIWGKKDAYLEYKMADMSGKYIEDYTLKCIDDASHWAQMDRPDIVNKHIRDFVSEHGCLNN